MRRHHQAVLGWLCAGSAALASTNSTVSVFLPKYDDSDWAALRGSILSSDESATAYTVFCADQAPGCHIAGELPFIFTEGPQTLTYTGSAPGTLTADLECELDGTTAATCTGSSSLGPHIRQGSLTGPTQTVWTTTFAAAEVTWGVLTLATPGPLPGTTNIDGTVIGPLPTAPIPTTSASKRVGPSGWATAVLFGAAALIGCL
ncbi:hypothetical protein VTK26DRAFT_251 [Humicola hyalothermophila]